MNNDKKTKSTIMKSRRDFIKAASAASGIAALGGVAPMLMSKKANAAPREMTLLAWYGHGEKDIVEAFEQANNCKVKAKYYTGGDNMLALIAQSPPGTYDVVLSDAEYVLQLKEAGFVEKLNPSDYPFDDYWPEFQRFGGHWSGKELYSVALRFGFLGVSYNSENISEKEAMSYSLLWDEKLKGRVGHFDWHLPNLGCMSMYMGNPNPYDINQKKFEALTSKTMEIRSQVNGFYDYGGTFSSLKNGQIQAMCGIGDWITGVLQKDGSPVRTVIPEEGGLQWTESLCIGKNAKNHDLARKFIQYMSSPEGQVRSANMAAYPAAIVNKKAWELLAKVTPEEAKRQRMELGKDNVISDIRNGRVKYRTLPVQQSLETWNDFWLEYKNS
ncbi:spermidine/putrescine ABC transporter substrate-binding protein [Dasania sp. GY-MA-18]|uniref:Spermidine/putrescine ABC transporter substrate-binding protein n=1 Tax=Dasania phycosphaerae TaxID=2950436 RepID=A0A9J6RP15_9GAMM|nr:MULTISPECIES: spermidine/putrescine ABC transporter substrate-binding protein [Dasania]MCR8923494.1 spermidine/putrescine ABC transporter substrate-binding protein [Dasania sp. GY-MA-18]MCZ0865928.1 spermidine/putrescine ABC transporter substrate-binding protein [Dasania phycosphaerae]MCZ0869652.1 spermidine/putrescine ABC transporter substrate-binding protein [Dasania phycosphaerae]